MTEYTVRLEAFEGPIDLLYYLIRRAEVEITEIPIAEITDQYIAFLEGIERVDIDKAGEFLVMAATLMEIKSRVLGAASLEGETQGGQLQAEKEEPDPLAELVGQLLEYKRFRDAAETLENRLAVWSKRYPAGRSGVDAEEMRAILDESRSLDIEDLSVVDLVEAFEQICLAINFDRLGEHEIIADDTPIELYAEDMVDVLQREAEAGRRSLTLRQIFVGRARNEMIGLFLALLELVRNRRVRVQQDAESGEIVVMLREEPDYPPVADPAAGEEST